MAISSSRSLSPISSRRNSNSKNPESSSNGRKSFSGNPLTRPSIVPNARSFNPVTPANSPADSSQRNWVCREGIPSLLGSFEHKENERDQNLKPVRVRSPAVSMGSKNFMAPTISAASKIAPSPRKKVLAERNEAVRTSVLISEEKSPFGAMNPKEFVEEIGSKLEVVFHSQVRSETQNTLEVLSMAPSISEISNVTATPKSSSYGNPPFTTMNPLNFSEVDEIGPKPDGDLNSLSEPRLVDSNNKPPSSSSSVLAPLDVDPSVPYDPKTNYLSPRPQFLHYKPNPRIEVYLNKERGFDTGEGRRLEDSFTSERCLGSENTEETQFSDSQKETEDASSESMSEEEKETNISSPKPDNSHMKKDVVPVKKISNSRSFSRSKSSTLLLILVVACLSFSVIDSPVITPSELKDQTFSKLDSSAKIAKLAKANLDELAYEFRLWSIKSVLYLSKLISIPRETKELGPFHFMNLTALDQELLFDGYESVDFGGYETEEKQEKNSLEPEKEEQTEEDPKGEHNRVEIETEEPEKEEQTEEDPKGENNRVEIETEEPKKEEQTEEEPKGVHNRVEIETEEPKKEEQTEEEPKGEQNRVEIETGAKSVELATVEHFNIESPLISQVLEIKPEMSEVVEFHDQENFDSHIKIEPLGELNAPSQSLVSSSQYVNSRSTESLEISIHGSGNNSPVSNGLGIASVLLTFIASTVFLYLKRKNTSTQEAVVLVKQLPPKKLASSSSLSASCDSQNLYHERRSSSQNWPTEVVEMVGESGPLEISSSFPNSLSFGRRGSERANEVQSHERNLRRNPNRESLASSSEYSAGTSLSYGSFTTYEKIHSKHGCGEDEVVTPVRRSSRIRNQITSP